MEKRTIITMLTGLILAAHPQAGRAADKESLKGTITLSGAWALYPMAVTWAAEFRKIHPDVKIDISAGGAGKGVADALAGVVEIGMVSRDINPAEIKKGAWWVSVTKDAVVPVINAKNPHIKNLLSKGVKKETFTGLWITGRNKDFHVYTRSDACGAGETWAQYLGKKQEDLLGTGVYGDPGLASAVKKDALGIGYNNVNFVYDAKTKKPVEGLKILPIDLNNNGTLDKDEDFYNTRSDLVNAIIAGKYPSPPARDLHFVCGGKPKKIEVVEFIKWVLTDGQRFVSDAGYIKLGEAKLKEGLKKVND
ncbi:MAG: substrate-binding domain-containing protein [Phycisphaerae bacterium]